MSNSKVKGCIDFKACDLNAVEMYNVFQRKRAAYEALRSTMKKSGTINSARLAKVYTDDDIFARRVYLPEGKSHGISVLLDWSASMSDVRGEAMSQLYTLYRFSKMAGITFCAYQFTSGYGSKNIKDVALAKFLGNTRFDYVLDSSVSVAESQKFINDAYERSQNGTPLQNAMLASAYITHSLFSEANVQNRNLFIISDGENSDRAIKSFTSAVTYKQYILENDSTLHQPAQFADDMGIKVYNIHIECGELNENNFSESSRFVKCRAYEPSRIKLNRHKHIVTINNCAPFTECVIISESAMRQGDATAKGDVFSAQYDVAAKSTIARYVAGVICTEYEVK